MSRIIKEQGTTIKDKHFHLLFITLETWYLFLDT